ncbi:MAG: NADPH-dependent FMN reductase [Gemmatimonadales bacterium]
MYLLAFAASLRAGSWNRKLLNVAVPVAREAGVEVDVAQFGEFDAPMYNADVQSQDGFPPGVEEFVGRLERADGLMIASPEYNFSLPGTLKNLIDWVSRKRPMPLRGKSALLLAASTSVVGGIRGLWQLRIPLEGLGVFVYPDMYALPSAQDQFDEAGHLKDAARRERLEKLVRGYLKAGRALAGGDE